MIESLFAILAFALGWWLRGLWGWFETGDSDSWDVRIRRTADDPSGTVVYQEPWPSSREAWARAKELAGEMRRGHAPWDDEATTA